MSPETHSSSQSAQASQLLREYAASLWARIPSSGSSTDPLRAAQAHHRAQSPEESAALKPPRPSSDPVRAGNSAGASVRARPAHDALGLGALARAWPPGGEDAIDRLADLVAAVDSLWGPMRPADALERRAVEQLLDRRDEIVELVSIRLYLGCRAIGLAVDPVEQGAQELAAWLGRRLYGSERMVFAAKRGRFIEGEQQLEVREGVAAVEDLVVRGLSFGIRRADGSIARRACVEREPKSGGAP